jgi:hypothetical protein
MGNQASSKGKEMGPLPKVDVVEDRHLSRCIAFINTTRQGAMINQWMEDGYALYHMYDGTKDPNATDEERWGFQRAKEDGMTEHPRAFCMGLFHKYDTLYKDRTFAHDPWGTCRTFRSQSKVTKNAQRALDAIPIDHLPTWVRRQCKPSIHEWMLSGFARQNVPEWIRPKPRFDVNRAAFMTTFCDSACPDPLADLTPPTTPPF